MDTMGAVWRRLAEQTDRYVSGEALAAELGVSRNAVWKAVEALRARGCDIEAKPRHGYRLRTAPDGLDAASVLPGLLALQAAPLFHRIIYVPETPSTNDVAKREARAGAPEGTVVTTNYQTAGRGRRGRSWVSPPGTALAFSVVLRPPIQPRQASLLVFLAATAVREAVVELLPASARRGSADPGAWPDESALIKWPNDVVVGGRKLSGVLVEMSAELDRVHWCVVGVGVNVNQLPGHFPPGLREAAASLRWLAGRQVPRALLLQRILAGMARRYHRVLQGGFDELLAETRRWSATIGRHVRIHEADGTYWDGRAHDIQDDGALLVYPTSHGPGATRPGRGTGRAGETPVAVYAADVSVRGRGDDTVEK